VVVGDQGIIQTIVRRRFVKWSDVVSWERAGDHNSKGPETLTIHTRVGSVTLNHNCVYGKRLDFVESELKRRVAHHSPKQAAAATSRSAARSTSPVDGCSPHGS